MAIPLIAGEETEKQSDLLEKRYRQVLESIMQKAPVEELEKQFPKLEPPTPFAERMESLAKYATEKETRPKSLMGIFDLGAKASEALTEVGKVNGEPVYFDPTMLAGMPALGSIGIKGGAKTLPALAVEKDPQGFYSVLENLFKTKAGKTVTPEEITGIAKGAKAAEVEQSGIESLKHTGPYTKESPYRRSKIPTEEVLEKIKKEKPVLSFSESFIPELDRSSPYFVPQLVKSFKEWQGSGMSLDDFIANESSVYYALKKKNPKLVEDPQWASKVVNSVFKIDDLTKVPRWTPYTIPGGSKYKETLITLEGPKNLTQGSVSSSPHFIEPNIVAWTRTDIRPDADGKSVLFAQEIQSDWAKQARKKGTYSEEIHEYIQNLNSSIDEQYKKFIQKLSQEKDPKKQQVLRNEWEEIEKLYQDLIRENQDKLWNKVPATPYVETEAYVDLIIKKLIQQAVENKNDRIGIIPGQLVTELYPGIGEKEKKSLIEFYNNKIPSRLKKAANAYGGKIGETVVSIHEAIPSLEGLGKPIIDAAIKKKMATKVPYLEITDEVKEHVKRGLPIISAAGIALPSLVEEYRKQKESEK